MSALTRGGSVQLSPAAHSPTQVDETAVVVVRVLAQRVATVSRERRGAGGRLCQVERRVHVAHGQRGLRKK